MRKHTLLRIGLAAAGIMLPVLLALTYNHFFASAQGTHIAYGETASGEIIEPGEADVWTFDGTRNDTLTIHVARQSGDLIPAIELDDPDNRTAMSLDWPEQGPPEVLFTVRLRMTGAYTITIRGHGGTTGRYTLNLALLESGEPTNSQEGMLAYGTAVTGTISDSVFREFWSFRGTRGDVIDVLMTAVSGDLDAYLMLLSPQGDVLLSSDTGGSGRDAALFAFQLPTSGTYSIVARRAGANEGDQGTTQGMYNLALTLRRPGVDDSAITPSRLVPGTAIRGRLNANAPTALYTIDASGVLSVALDATDPAQISTVSVMTPNRALLGVFSGVSPMRSSVVLPGDGPVWIEVSAANIQESAPVDFSLTASPLVVATRTSRALQYGRPQIVNSTPEQPDAWHFFGHAGDLVAITAAPFGESWNGGMQVFSPDGGLLITRAITSSVAQPLALQTGGVYEIIITSHAASSEYRIGVELLGIDGISFEQRVVPTEQGLLLPGANRTVSGVLQPGDCVSWALDAAAPQVWRFDLTQAEHASPAVLAVLAPDGHQLAVAATDDLTRSARLQIELTQIGRYRLLVFDQSGQDAHTYTLGGEPVEGGKIALNAPAKGVLDGSNTYDLWTVDTLPDALLNIHIDPVTDSSPPAIHVIGPDGLLAASSTQGTGSPLDMSGIPTARGGVFRLIVAQPRGSDRLVYRITANVSQPFGVETALNNGLHVGLSESTGVTPAPTVQQVVIPDVIMPPVDLDAPYWRDAQRIEPETLVRGELPEGELYQAWTFAANAGQMFGFSVVALDDNARPGMMLLDQNGTVLGENFEPTNASSYLAHRFTASAAYALVVKLDRPGRYNLWISPLTNIDETIPLVLPGQAITYGQTADGELFGASDSRLFVFFGHSGDVVSARVLRAQGPVAPAVTLATASGEPLAEDSAPRAAIEGYALPANGLYQLRVSQRGQSGGRGRFVLSLMLQQATQSTDLSGGLLEDQQIAALSATDATHRWLFNAESGERVTLRVEPLSVSAPDPLRFQVTDSAGNVFLQKETRAGQRVLVFSDVMLPHSGVYQAVISGGQRQTGLYRVSLERDPESLYDDDCAIRYGQTVGKVLTLTNFLDVWTLAGSAGDVVTITARPVSGDDASISLQLRARNGEILGTVAADETTRVAGIEHVILPLTGHYSIIVGNVDSAFQGETAYELTAHLESTIARSMGSVLAYGEVVGGVFFADDPADVWLFQGKQGDVITATVTSQTPGLEAALSLVSTDWHVASATGQAEILAEVQGLDGEAAQISLMLPTSAPYALVVSESARRSGQYRLELTKQAAPPFPSRPIRPDQERSGEIGATVPYEAWTFAGTADSVVSINVEPDSRSNLAPLIRLLDPAGAVLAEAEAASGEHTRIDAYRLPTSGTYSILVTRVLGVGGGSTGRYTMTLQETEPASTAYFTITFEQRARGVLDSSNPVEHVVFNGTQGDIVRVYAEATSDNLDPMLLLYDPEGVLLAAGDDEQGSNARIDAELLVSGVYTVEVRRYGGAQGTTSGNYVLSVTPVYSAAASMPERMMAYGSRVSGAADSTTPSDDWAFIGEQFDVISATVQFPVDDAPLMLYLLDPAGNVLATGVRDGGNMVIDSFTLPGSRLYVFEVRRPGDARTRYSPYTLSLDLLSTTYQTPVQGGILVPGEAVAGQFVQAGVPHAWFFDGTAGQSLSFSLNRLSGELAVDLLLVAPDGSSVFTSTLPADTVNSLSTPPVTLPLDGLYLLLITDNAQTPGTTYRLFVQPTGAIDDSAQVIAPLQDKFGIISDVQPRESWQFDARAGESVSLRVAALDGNLQPSLVLWDSTGRPVMEGIQDPAGDTTQVTLSNAFISQSGTYRVTVGRVGGAAGDTTGSYRLMLRRRPISRRAVLAEDVAFETETIDYFAGPDPRLYAFQGLAGDVVAVSARVLSGETVPSLSLENEMGMSLSAPVVTSDDEASISAFTLPENGRYVVVLAGSHTGSYAFSVFRRTRELSDGGLMRNLGRGQTFAEGILDPAQPTHWQFSGQTGEVLAFTVDTTNSGLRADVALYGPRGYITSAVEQPGSRQTVIGPVRLPDDGGYVLVVGPWMGTIGGTTGRYSVRVEAPGPDVSGSTGGHIAVRNQAVIGGLIPTDDQDTWTFDGKAGEIITVRAERLPGNGSLRLTLVGPDGTELAASQPDSTRAGIEITSALIPESGLYSLVVKGQLSGDETIEYRLAVAQVQRPVTASMQSAEGIAYGEQQQGELSNAQRYQAWVFFGQAGEQIRSTVGPSDSTLTPELYVLSPDGRILYAANNPVAGGSVQVAGLALPQSGFYGLVVGTRSTAEHQPYTIVIERESAGALDQGVLQNEATGTLTQAAPAHEWTIQPGASGDYLLRVSSFAAGEEPRLFILSASDVVLATGTVEEYRVVQIVLRLEKGQSYAALVSGGPFITQGQYTIRVEPASLVTHGGDLLPDMPNVGRITDEHFSDEWRIQVGEDNGLAVEITRTSGDLIPAVALYNANGLLIRQETAGGDGAMQTTFEALAAGDYHLLVSRLDGGAGRTEGNYAITIRLEP